MFDQTQATLSTQGEFALEETISARDREILRRLASQVAELAARPIEQQKRDLWYRLIDVLQKLVDEGNTVAVIEHNMEIIREADYIIDLGPEGGDEGGYVIGCGSPEEITSISESYTGQYLAKILGKTSQFD